MRMIRVHAPMGVREYPAFEDSNMFEKAKADGRIAPGDEIIYRGIVVTVQEDYSMLVIGPLAAIGPVEVLDEL